MKYRQKKTDLLDTLRAWNELLPGRGKVHLIACGGTALTLLGHKDSTKDVDFLVPFEEDYKKLTTFLKDAGYQNKTSFGWQKENDQTIYDLFPGKKVYCTELLDSPMNQDKHSLFENWSKIYIGILNPMDLMITKLFRGTHVDFEDTLVLFQNEAINKALLKTRYRETASYDVGEEKVLKNLELFWEYLEEKTKGKKNE